MAFSMPATRFELELPQILQDAPTDTKQIWKAKQVTHHQRLIAENMFANQWRSFGSTMAQQAYFSFVDSTFTWLDEKKKEVRMFPEPRGDERLDLQAEFLPVWDALPADVQSWVMEKIVWKINPQWRPEGLMADYDQKKMD